jgi:hypothetical protein
MKALWTAIACVFLFSLPAEASDWRFVTRTASCKFFVDIESIKSAGRHIAEAWTKMSYDTPKHNEKIGRISYMTKRIEYDCIRDRVRYHERTFFGKDDQILYSSSAVSPWKNLTQDTALMNLQRFVCVFHWDLP